MRVQSQNISPKKMLNSRLISKELNLNGRHCERIIPSYFLPQRRGGAEAFLCTPQCLLRAPACRQAGLRLRGGILSLRPNRTPVQIHFRVRIPVSKTKHPDHDHWRTQGNKEQ